MQDLEQFQNKTLISRKGAKLAKVKSQAKIKKQYFFASFAPLRETIDNHLKICIGIPLGAYEIKF